MRGHLHAPAALYPREDPVPIVQEAGWAPGLICTGAENLAPSGIRSPDRLYRSQSLYRLRWPADLKDEGSILIKNFGIPLSLEAASHL